MDFTFPIVHEDKDCRLQIQASVARVSPFLPSKHEALGWISRNLSRRDFDENFILDAERQVIDSNAPDTTSACGEEAQLKYMGQLLDVRQRAARL